MHQHRRDTRGHTHPVYKYEAAYRRDVCTYVHDDDDDVTTTRRSARATLFLRRIDTTSIARNRRNPCRENASRGLTLDDCGGVMNPRRPSRESEESHSRVTRATTRKKRLTRASFRLSTKDKYLFMLHRRRTDLIRNLDLRLDANINRVIG